jgi:hypothetical protein
LQILQASGAPNEGLCGVPKVVAQEGDSIQRRMNELELRRMNELEFVSSMNTSFQAIERLSIYNKQ